MNTAEVLVYGRGHARPELETNFRLHLPDMTVQFSDSFDPPGADALLNTDVVLFFVESGASNCVIRDRLARISSAFSYLPLFVIIAESPLNVSELGAARFLPAILSDFDIARETSHAFRSTWWHGISRVNRPFMIVDRTEVIVRANVAARQQFGDNLVGKPYCEVIEKSSEVKMPVWHPIRKVLDMTGDPKSLCEYREFPIPSLDANRVNLVCVGIEGLKGAVNAVGVLFVSVDRWARIFQCAKTLAQASTLEELYEAIVREVRNLGYRRARLYQLIHEGKILKGRASIGFEPQRDQSFREKFGMNRADYFQNVLEIEVAADGPSRDTLGDRCFPALCVCRQDASQESMIQCDLERFYDNRRLHPFELDCEDTERWIDVPFLLPSLEIPNGELTKWGKLSVDCAEESGRLNAQDVADLTMFATIAAGYLAAVIRSEQQREQACESMKAQREQLDLFRTKAERLTAGLRTSTTNRVLFVRKLLLEMYQQLTDADIVYFRQYDGRYPNDTLCLAKDSPRWRREAASDEFDIPYEVLRGDSFSARLLERVDANGSWIGATEPLRVPSANESYPPVDSVPNKWSSEKQRSFLLEHQSALHIPVIVSGKFRGAIIALNQGDRKFKVDSAAVQRFMDTAALWYELGELQDDQLLLASTLEQVLRNLPKLATAPDTIDELAFFAGLANVVTAHVGLGWNRVWVFQRIAPGTMELVYAHGGTGEDEEHSILRKQLSGRFDDLGELLDIRLKNPEPKRDDGSLDPLFKYCVDLPRTDGHPIRVHFGDGDEATETNPLREILADDYRLGPSMTVPQKLKLKKEWFHGPREFPEAMIPTGEVYAFPLWCMYSDQKEPLGFILVEMLYDPQRRIDGMKEATRLILGLAANILAFRHQQRRTLGMFKKLSIAEHGVTIVEEWDEFARKTGKLLQKLAIEKDSNLTVSGLLESLQYLVAETERQPESVGKIDQHQVGPIEQLSSSLNTINERLNRLFEAQTAPERKIDDVVDFVERTLEPFKEKGVFIDWVENGRPSNAIHLACDPLVLNEAISCLVQNSRAAAKKAGRPAEFYVAVREIPLHSQHVFEKLLELEFTDNGNGVPESFRRLIFHDGFSCWDDATPMTSSVTGKSVRGKGLGLIRNQLRAYRGDVQLVSSGVSVSRPGNVVGHVPQRFGPVGATFVISFGISRVASVPKVRTERQLVTSGL